MWPCLERLQDSERAGVQHRDRAHGCQEDVGAAAAEQRRAPGLPTAVVYVHTHARTSRQAARPHGRNAPQLHVDAVLCTRVALGLPV